MLGGLAVEGGAGLVLARGAADAAVLSAFGALLFLAMAGFRPPLLAGQHAPAARRRLVRVAWLSLVASAILTLGWAALQASAIGGSPADVAVVLQDTWFGHVVLARLVLLALAGLAFGLRRGRLAATVLAGLAVASLAGQGHAVAMYEGPSWLLASETLHLLAAGAWLGGLIPLAVFVAAMPVQPAALASRRFAPLGTLCVIVIAGTALFQSSVLVATVPGLIGTAYGLVALAKAGLLLGLLAFAARNRFRLTPALAGPEPAQAKARLRRSIAEETGVGLLAVLAAALLTSLAPSMHVQPIWPFPRRLSLDAVSEEPAFLREVLLAVGLVVASVVLAGAAFLLRWRARWLVAVVPVAAVWLAMPHLDLLLVPAYPTQYWSTPTGFSSVAIAEGKILFPQHCAVCHGAQGRGDGPAAGSLPIPPANLTQPHLWAHPDGELFWWVSHGIEGPDGTLVMPGFASVLTEDQRWALIDWVRANNAGLARVASGGWTTPVHAPAFDITCADRNASDLADLRGQVVRIVFGPAKAIPGAVTLATDPGTRPSAGLCAADDGAVSTAYAVVTGLDREALRGAEVLVDGQGWLRSVLQRTPGDGGDNGEIASAIRAIERQPLAAAPMTHAGMKM